MNTAVDRLQFAVRFAETRLDGFRPGDLLNLREDLAGFLGYGPKGRDAPLGALGGVFTYDLKPPAPPEYPEDRLRALQAEVKSVLRAVVETRQQIPAQRRALEGGGVRFGPPFRPGYVVPELTITVKVQPAWFEVANPTPAAADRNILWVSGPVRDVFLLVLTFLLAHEPASRIQGCPECGRLFFRVRRQRYCSRGCVNKANLRAHRRRLRSRPPTERPRPRRARQPKKRGRRATR